MRRNRTETKSCVRVTQNRNHIQTKDTCACVNRIEIIYRQYIQVYASQTNIRGYRQNRNHIQTGIYKCMRHQNRNNAQPENTGVCVTQNKIIHRQYIQVYASHRINRQTIYTGYIEIIHRQYIQIYRNNTHTVYTGI
jgi:hypothetical protein